MFEENPFEFFDSVIWKVNEPVDNVVLNYFIYNDNKLISGPNEMFLNNYYFLNLGNKIKLGFPTFALDNDPNEPTAILTYKTSKYFTPYEIVKIIYSYYNQPATLEEYKPDIRQDLKAIEMLGLGGNIKKYHLLERVKISGLGKYIDINYLRFSDNY